MAPEGGDPAQEGREEDRSGSVARGVATKYAPSAEEDEAHGRRGPGLVLVLRQVRQAAGALAALCTIIAQQAGNISYMQITKRTSDFFTLFLDVEVVNLAQLNSIITVVRSSQFVESVERIMIQ